MKDYTNKYIRIYNKDTNTLIVMFVQEQENLDLENEYLFTGVGCCLNDKEFYTAMPYTTPVTVTKDYVIEELTRKHFLKLRNAMCATFFVKITRKTYCLDKCKK